MKTPMQYQISDYDCGPTSLLNALKFLFEREEIPPEIIKNIILYSLDSYNAKGELGKGGTSQMSMMFLSNWLNHYAEVIKLPIKTEYYSSEHVQITENSIIVDALRRGGAVIQRCWYDCGHYVLLTGVKGELIEFFDPYYRVKRFKWKDIEMLDGSGNGPNRRTTLERMNRYSKEVYCLGNDDKRESMVIYNTRTVKTPEATIEYFI
jgi:hypothetical protein